MVVVTLRSLTGFFRCLLISATCALVGCGIIGIGQTYKEDIGPQIVSHYNDERKRFVDPDNFNEEEFTIEYENTSALETEIDGYRDTGNSIACRLIRKNVNKDFNAMFGATSKTGQYDKVERAVTRLYLIPS